ncbi:tetratricopeptide repeat protein [Bacillus taeanensis]|nr:tetratricopeptide repeat protein [Bacillus taeanensis]
MKKEKVTNESGQLIPFIQSGDYYFERALSFYKKRDLHKAKKYLQRAVKLEPHEAAYICQLAAVQAELGEYIESNEWFEKIMQEIDPDMSECHFFIANNYAHLGMFDEAEKQANLYLTKDPDGEFAEDLEELLWFIEETFEGEEIESPLVDYEEEIIHQHEQARKRLESGDFYSAISLLEKMTAEHPTFWAAYNNLALAYFYSGQSEEALSVLKEVLTENPGNLHALCNAALFYHFLKMDEKSGILAERLKKVYPTHLEHRYKLASTFGMLGEHEIAYARLTKLKKYGFEWEPSFYHWFAVSAFMTGRKAQAKREWKRLKEIDPHNQIAEECLARLEKGTLHPEHLHEQSATFSQHPYGEQSLEDVRKETEAKVLQLFLLRDSGKAKDYEMLKQFCENREEPLLLKEVAAFTMLEIHPHETVVVKEKANSILYKAKEELPAFIHHAVDIKDKLAKRFSALELEQVMTCIWLKLFGYARLENMPLQNTNAWAAAGEYAWRKQYADPISQKKLAKEYELSPVTISKYVKQLQQIIENEQ